jgi:hypothetical protein
MATKDLDRDLDHGSRPFWLNENVRGAVILVLGVAALIGISYGAMMALTSPDGWVARAASNAATGEQQPTALVSFDNADDPQ